MVCSSVADIAELNIIKYFLKVNRQIMKEYIYSTLTLINFELFTDIFAYLVSPFVKY